MPTYVFTGHASDLFSAVNMLEEKLWKLNSEMFIFLFREKKKNLWVLTHIWNFELIYLFHQMTDIVNKSNNVYISTDIYVQYI